MTSSTTLFPLRKRIACLNRRENIVSAVNTMTLSAGPLPTYTQHICRSVTACAGARSSEPFRFHSQSAFCFFERKIHALQALSNNAVGTKISMLAVSVSSRMSVASQCWKKTHHHISILSRELPRLGKIDRQDRLIGDLSLLSDEIGELVQKVVLASCPATSSHITAAARSYFVSDLRFRRLWSTAWTWAAASGPSMTT